MAALLDDLRAAGLPMISRYLPREAQRTDENGEDVRHITQTYLAWTTDPVKANAARELGATVTSYRALDPSACGWEVSVSVVVE